MPINPVVSRLLSGDEAYATTLLAIVIDRYGTEALQWAPETIRRELEQDFGVKVSKTTLDRLMAGISLLTTDFFFNEVSRFIQLAKVLSDDDFDPEVFEPATTEECAWAITEAMLLAPQDDEMPFSDDIRHYLGAIMTEEGLIKTPDILRIALRDSVDPQISSDLAADSEMMQAIFQNQLDRSREIDVMVQENMADMLHQLTMLQLENGDVTRLVKHIRRGLSIGAVR